MREIHESDFIPYWNGDGAYIGASAVYLYTPLCGTCKVGLRMMEVVEAMLPNRKLLQMNLNFAPQMVTRYQIRSVPCLLLFHADSEREPEAIYDMRSVEHLYTLIKGVVE